LGLLLCGLAWLLRWLLLHRLLLHRLLLHRLLLRGLLLHRFLLYGLLLYGLLLHGLLLHRLLLPGLLLHRLLLHRLLLYGLLLYRLLLHRLLLLHGLLLHGLLLLDGLVHRLLLHALLRGLPLLLPTTLLGHLAVGLRQRDRRVGLARILGVRFVSFAVIPYADRQPVHGGQLGLLGWLLNLLLGPVALTALGRLLLSRVSAAVGSSHSQALLLPADARDRRVGAEPVGAGLVGGHVVPYGDRDTVHCGRRLPGALLLLRRVLVCPCAVPLVQGAQRVGMVGLQAYWCIGAQ